MIAVASLRSFLRNQEAKNRNYSCVKLDVYLPSFRLYATRVDGKTRPFVVVKVEKFETPEKEEITAVGHYSFSF